MSGSAASDSPESLPSIIARLRAAGCVFAEDEAELLCAAAVSSTELAALVERRVAGVPLEQVLGWAEFCGLRIAVDPGVFVPRRRSEFLVHQAAAVLADTGTPGPTSTASPIVLVDLCCGSGAIGVALVAALGSVDLHAADIDPAAVRCARRNVVPVGGQVHEGDLYRALPSTLRGRVDLLVVNAPYVPTASISMMPSEARDHEPMLALDGGVDGLDVQRRVIAAAPAWLAADGLLLIETSERQAEQTSAVIARSGLIPRIRHSDELSATVVIGAARRFD